MDIILRHYKFKRKLLFICFSCLAILALSVNYPDKSLPLSIFWLTAFFYVRGADTYPSAFLALTLIIDSYNLQAAVLFLYWLTWQRQTQNFFFLEQIKAIKTLFVIATPLLVLLFFNIPTLPLIFFAALSSQFLGGYLIKHLPEGIYSALNQKLKDISILILSFIDISFLYAYIAYLQYQFISQQSSIKYRIALSLRLFVIASLISHILVLSITQSSLLLCLYIPSFIHILNQSLCMKTIHTASFWKASLKRLSVQ